jgi:SAM-dependent methyltransferase
MKDGGRKTNREFWAYPSEVRLRLPSPLWVHVSNITRLLRRRVRAGDRYLEIGCAPGKLLAWVAAKLGAEASGLDYAPNGIHQCQRLFDASGLNIPLYREDLFSNTLPAASFDVVASFGFIEHFDDPAPAVEQHLRLVKPGGLALITIPNYGGVYGSLQGRLNPENLAAHNVGIMKPDALLALGKGHDARVYYTGSMDASLLSLERAMPAKLARVLQLALNGVGRLQPVMIRSLAPALVLEIRCPRTP